MIVYIVLEYYSNQWDILSVHSTHDAAIKVMNVVSDDSRIIKSYKVDANNEAS